MQQTSEYMITTLLVLLTTWSATPSLANDTPLAHGAGNLRFGKSSGVAIVSEVLTLSPKDVEVNYVFRNQTDKTEELDVAFPFPKRLFYSGSTDTGTELPEASLIVDGKEVSFKWERRFFLNNEELPSTWGPLFIEAPGAMGASTGDPGAWKNTVQYIQNHGKLKMQKGYKEVLELTQLYQEHFKRSDFEQLSSVHVQEILVWKASFPSKKEIRVRHFFPNAVAVYGYENSEKEACLTEPPAASRWKDIRGKRGISLSTIRYILKTGSNWATPIGEFTLIVKKKNPTDIVSTCFSGLKRISPLELRAKRTNFLPKEDLTVVWIPLLKDAHK